MAITSAGAVHSSDVRQRGFELALERSHELHSDFVATFLETHLRRPEVVVSYNYLTEKLKVHDGSKQDLFDVGVLYWPYDRVGDLFSFWKAYQPKDILRELLEREPQVIVRAKCDGSVHDLAATFEVDAMTKASRIVDAHKKDEEVIYLPEVQTFIVDIIEEKLSVACSLAQRLQWVPVLELMDEDQLIDTLRLVYQAHDDRGNGLAAIFEFAISRYGESWAVHTLNELAKECQMQNVTNLMHMVVRYDWSLRMLTYESDLQKAVKANLRQLKVVWFRVEDIGVLYDFTDYTQHALPALMTDTSLLADWIDYGLMRFEHTSLVRAVYQTLNAQEWQLNNLELDAAISGIRSSQIADTLDGVYQNVNETESTYGLRSYAHGITISVTHDASATTLTHIPKPSLALYAATTYQGLSVGLGYMYHLELLSAGYGPNESVAHLLDLIKSGDIDVLHPQDVWLGDSIAIKTSLIELGELR